MTLFLLALISLSERFAATDFSFVISLLSTNLFLSFLVLSIRLVISSVTDGVVSLSVVAVELALIACSFNLLLAGILVSIALVKVVFFPASIRLSCNDSADVLVVVPDTFCCVLGLISVLSILFSIPLFTLFSTLVACADFVNNFCAPLNIFNRSTVSSCSALFSVPTDTF